MRLAINPCFPSPGSWVGVSMFLAWCCGLFLLPDSLLGGSGAISVECYCNSQPYASVLSSSYGRGRVRSPEESPRGSTWKPAAGCVKEGENILSSQLYHTLLLGMEVAVWQD